MIIVKWYDNKPVHLISFYSGVEPRDKCNRWSVALKQRVEIDRPPIEKDYNRYMGGVDLWDMMIKFIKQTSEATNVTCKLFTIALIWQL